MQAGTFMTRLKETDEEVWSCDEEILFFCFDCEEIAALSHEEHKLVTQYVEHKVHENCMLNLPTLAPIERIISDTTKTAPARCRHPWADDLAKKVFQEIAGKLNCLR